MKKKSSNQKRYKKNQPEGVKIVQGKTDNQLNYIRSIVENEIIFCTGPSGCGKSFIASGISSQKLHLEQTDNIIITRPLECSGKEIGSLPGELNEKISPYLLPMKQNYIHFIGRALYGPKGKEKRN